MNKQRAYSAIHNRLARGELVRPSHCNRCGKADVKASDGRSTIHAHHNDYSKPLDVEWLCAKCHAKDETPHPNRKVRPESSGELNPLAKLSNKDADDIRSSKLSGPVLARKYGVCSATIYRIKHNKGYIAAYEKEQWK
jgi:hypothetical protein